MISAMKELDSFNEQLFPNVEKSVYVPPSMSLSPEGRAVMTHEIPEVKTIASTYFPGILPTRRIWMGCWWNGRTTSCGDSGDSIQLAAFSELNLRPLISPFIHRMISWTLIEGAELGWELSRRTWNPILAGSRESAPSLRDLTGSSYQFWRCTALAPKQRVTSTGIQWTFESTSMVSLSPCTYWWRASGQSCKWRDLTCNRQPLSLKATQASHHGLGRIRMRICLILEGYPYVHGGVSTWMHPIHQKYASTRICSLGDWG